MTYNQFISQVRPLLFLDSDNPETSVQELIDQSVRSWAVMMQSLIETYRTNNVNTLDHTDFTDDCDASKGSLPSGCDLNEIIIFKEDEDDADCPFRYEPKYHPWQNRGDLIDGTAPKWSVSINPQMTDFYVYPKVEDGTTVKIYWEGLKNDYGGEDDVIWGTDAIPCCAAYVNSRIALMRDDKIQRAREYEREYERTRKRVVLNEQRRSDPRHYPVR